MDESAIDEITPLLDGLRPGQPGVRRTVNALVVLGAPAVEPLIGVLQTGPWQARQQAAKALGRIGDARAVEALIGALKHGRLRVRQQAARALGRIRDPRAAAPLIATLNDRAWDVRREAGLALIAIGRPATPPLLAVLFSSKARGRSRPEAARMLGAMAARHPSPELRTALPVLNRLARSFWGGREVKDIYLTAAQQIEAATAALKDLPTPSTRPQPTAEGLPFPAETPSFGTETLPLPAATSEASQGRASFAAGWWQRIWRKLVR